MQLAMFTPLDAQSFFPKEWFVQLFNSHPILKRFATTQMIISTDELQRLPKLTIWQQNLYQALMTLNLSGVEFNTRYSELERTVFSIMFIEAIRLYNKGGKAFIQSVIPPGNEFSDSDYKKINTLFTQIIPNFVDGGEDLELFKLACVFGDIAKIHAVREGLGSPTADQDLALDFILSLDTSKLCQYFSELNQQQINYLKKVRFPLHLGHASQLECAYSKFQEVLDTKSSELHIRYAMAKQLADVAGARAQNGILLLNNKILQTYFTLLGILNWLVNGKNAYVAYKQYLDTLAPLAIFQQIQFSRQEDLYIAQRLFCQLRLQQMSVENFEANRSLITQAFSIILNTTEFCEYAGILTKYDNTRFSDTKFIHTPTYVPAIFSSLLNLYDAESCRGIADNKYAFALIVGCKFVSEVLKKYLKMAETNKQILNNPPCFNKLNALITKDLALVLKLFVNTDQLMIHENGDVDITLPNSGLKFIS